MKYAVIRNGIVANIVVASAELAKENDWVACESDVNIGWLYADGSFSEPPRDIEKEWAAVRAMRNALLTETDKYVLSDRWITYSLDKQQEWSDYRQTLRDVPQSFADPADVIWPTKPE
jgi:hypothetical protein